MSEKTERRSQALLVIPFDPNKRPEWPINIAEKLRESGHDNAADFYEEIKGKAQIVDVVTTGANVQVWLTWTGEPYFDNTP